MPLRHTGDPDPITQMEWTVRRGLTIHTKRELRSLVYNTNPDTGAFCNARNETNHYTCTRPDGHPEHWKHVSADGYEVYSVWGGGTAPNDGELIDPEDGSPVDDWTLATITDIEIGGIYKLRDRVNKLQVIGGTPDKLPRKDGWIDVIDFTKKEQRALPLEEIVVAPGLTLTMDELTWSVKFAQSLRLKVRDEAVSNYHAGRWCEAGLQDGLRDLGLPKYVPTQAGVIAIKIPYTATTSAKSSSIKAAVKALVDEKQIKQWLDGLDDSNDEELELKLDKIDYGVQEVSRA